MNVFLPCVLGITACSSALIADPDPGPAPVHETDDTGVRDTGAGDTGNDDPVEVVPGSAEGGTTPWLFGLDAIIAVDITLEPGSHVSLTADPYTYVPASVVYTWQGIAADDMLDISLTGVSADATPLINGLLLTR